MPLARRLASPRPSVLAASLADRVHHLEAQVDTLADRQRALATTGLVPEEPPEPADDAPSPPARDQARAYQAALSDKARDTEWDGGRQDHFGIVWHQCQAVARGVALR